MLKWSEERVSNEECRYNHCIAETPFGQFLITWKGWKENPDYVIDETPWGEGMYDWFCDLQNAKNEAEKEFSKRILLCISLIKV